MRILGAVAALSLIGQYITAITYTCKHTVNYKQFNFVNQMFISGINLLFGLGLVISCTMTYESKVKKGVQKFLSFFSAPGKIVFYSLYFALSQAPQSLFKGSSYVQAQSYFLVFNFALLGLIFIYGILAVFCRNSVKTYYISRGLEQDAAYGIGL